MILKIFKNNNEWISYGIFFSFFFFWEEYHMRGWWSFFFILVYFSEESQLVELTMIKEYEIK